MAIHLHNQKHEASWNKGVFKIMIRAEGYDRPYGYSDGAEEDEGALVQMIEDQGCEEVKINKKMLKTGREVWTISMRLAS